MPKQLVRPAYGEKWHTVGHQALYSVRLHAKKVIGEECLIAVLTTTHERQIDCPGHDPITDPERHNLEIDTSPLASSAKRHHVSPVGVEVQQVGIEVPNPNTSGGFSRRHPSLPLR